MTRQPPPPSPNAPTLYWWKVIATSTGFFSATTTSYVQATSETEAIALVPQAQAADGPYTTKALAQAGGPITVNSYWCVLYTSTGVTSTNPDSNKVVQAKGSSQAIQSVGGGQSATGPFTKKADATASCTAQAATFPTGSNSGSGSGNCPNNGGVFGGAAQALCQINQTFASIANFFGDLGQPAFWVRAGKVVVGLILVTAGVMHITGMSQDVIPVLGKAASKLPEAAA